MFNLSSTESIKTASNTLLTLSSPDCNPEKEAALNDEVFQRILGRAAERFGYTFTGIKIHKDGKQFSTRGNTYSTPILHLFDIEGLELDDTKLPFGIEAATMYLKELCFELAEDQMDFGRDFTIEPLLPSTFTDERILLRRLEEYMTLPLCSDTTTYMNTLDLVAKVKHCRMLDYCDWKLDTTIDFATPFKVYGSNRGFASWISLAPGKLEGNVHLLTGLAMQRVQIEFVPKSILKAALTVEHNHLYIGIEDQSFDQLVQELTKHEQSIISYCNDLLAYEDDMFFKKLADRIPADRLNLANAEKFIECVLGLDNQRRVKHILLQMLSYVACSKSTFDFAAIGIKTTNLIDKAAILRFFGDKSTDQMKEIIIGYYKRAVKTSLNGALKEEYTTPEGEKFIDELIMLDVNPDLLVHPFVRRVMGITSSGYPDSKSLDSVVERLAPLLLNLKFASTLSLFGSDEFVSETRAEIEGLSEYIFWRRSL